MNKSLSLFMSALIVLGSLACAVAAPSAQYKVVARGTSDGMAWQLERLAQGLSVPWGMVVLDDAALLITERAGQLRRFDLSSGWLTLVNGVPPVYAQGQGGLLDLQLEPDYRPGGWLYFTYSKPVGDGGATTLARAKLSADQSTLLEWQDLLVTRSASTNGRHFGSRIAFDDHGHVFFSIGDRGHRPNGQDRTTHAGTILRLNTDGSLPQDNPFLSDNGVLPQIWSFGHRNPQGLVYDPDNDRLWSVEHGPRGGDELNLVEEGKNYGWARVSLGKEYLSWSNVGEAKSLPDMVDPKRSYTPSISPGSLLRYTGEALGAWRGDLFAGALSGEHLNRIRLDAEGRPVGEERLLEDLAERVRSLAQSADGVFYLATDNGNLYRLVPSG